MKIEAAGRTIGDLEPLLSLDVGMAIAEPSLAVLRISPRILRGMSVWRVLGSGGERRLGSCARATVPCDLARLVAHRGGVAGDRRLPSRPRHGSFRFESTHQKVNLQRWHLSRGGGDNLGGDPHVPDAFYSFAGH
jgi:hypothetical protein